jgi:hypothetical protein
VGRSDEFLLSANARSRQPSWNLIENRVKVLGVEHAIKYFSFWDVPRTFAFERGGEVYILMSEFDDNLDEYADDYEVFVVPDIGNLSVVSDWKSIEPLPKASVGTVPVASVRFDRSLRNYVDGSFLDSILRPETR